MTTEPLISLALPIKNGLPGLRMTMAALQRQAYRNFELIVQDGGSTDGSLDYLRGLGMPWVDIVSEPDTGIGQAYNRAFARCRGPMVVTLACDEWLEDNALQTFARWYERHPNAAVVYGAVRLWNNATEVRKIVSPGQFDFIKFLTWEFAPTTCGFFNKEVIGSDFYYDESLKTCPDFDLFIRLGLRFNALEIVEKSGVLLNAMSDRSSATYRVESYDQIARDRHYILDRFFVQQGNSELNHYLHNRCLASLYCRLAGHLLEIGGETIRLHHYILEAARYDPGSAALRQLVGMTKELEWDEATGQVLRRRLMQPKIPPVAAGRVDGVIDLSRTEAAPDWRGIGARTDLDGSSVWVTTAPVPWSYAAQTRLRVEDEWVHGGWYWIELRLRVESGEIGISIWEKPTLKSERLIAAGDGEVRVILPFLRTAEALLIRNAATTAASVVELREARVFGMPIPATQPEAVVVSVPAAAPPGGETRAPGWWNRVRDWFATLRSRAMQA